MEKINKKLLVLQKFVTDVDYEVTDASKKTRDEVCNLVDNYLLGILELDLGVVDIKVCGDEILSSRNEKIADTPTLDILLDEDKLLVYLQ